MVPTLMRIGWANLWRNPRRTAITVAALALGMVTLAFTISMMVGMTRDLIEGGTSLLIGHVEVHARGYRPDRSIFDTIPGDGRILAARLRAQPGVRGATPRAGSYALISAGEHSAGTEILGIDPATEPTVSTLLEHLVAGRAVADGAKEIAVGPRLARTLAVSPGDDLVVLTQAADGSLGNDVFSLTGVFRTGVDAIDGGLAVTGLDDLQDLLVLERGRIHEIAIRGSDPTTAPELALHLRQVVGSSGIEIAAWPTLAPEITAYVSMSDGWLRIMYLVVLSLAAIAILNTMLMAVFERFREFGVLAAIGMRPAQIVLLVCAEVAALAAVSLVAAVALGAPLLHWLIHTGIDLRSLTAGFTLSGVAMSPILRGAWTSREFAVSAALLVAFALLSGLYPAVRAARVDPAVLTRGEMR
jgi:ABC-type lipoprotein release transport system permease subunit